MVWNCIIFYCLNLFLQYVLLYVWIFSKTDILLSAKGYVRFLANQQTEGSYKYQSLRGLFPTDFRTGKYMAFHCSTIPNHAVYPGCLQTRGRINLSYSCHQCYENNYSKDLIALYYWTALLGYSKLRAVQEVKG